MEALSERLRVSYSSLLFCFERISARLDSMKFIRFYLLQEACWLSKHSFFKSMGRRRLWLDSVGARGDSFTARAGIGLEKFHINFMLLGANLFCGIIFELCLLLELAEDSDLIQESLLDSLSVAEGELN